MLIAIIKATIISAFLISFVCHYEPLPLFKVDFYLKNTICPKELISNSEVSPDYIVLPKRLADSCNLQNQSHLIGGSNILS
jgi:hypothetical protein